MLMELVSQARNVGYPTHPRPLPHTLGQENMYDLYCGGGRAHASDKRLQRIQEPSFLHKNDSNEHEHG